MTVVRDELSRLFVRDGHLTPEAVLAAAEPDDSPLHKFFTWDDSEAAAKQRLSEAGHLIRTCKIRVEIPKQRTIKIRAFLHVPADGETEATYAPVAKVMENTSHRDLVFAQALRDIGILERKYRDLVDFADVLDAAIAAVKRKVKEPAA